MHLRGLVIRPIATMAIRAISMRWVRLSESPPQKR